jgi:hypothetical protein
MCKGGAGENVIDTRELQVPDLWHIAMWLENNGNSGSSKKVLDCWHLAHDMKKHIQEQAGDCDAKGFTYPIGYEKPEVQGCTS